MDLSIIIPVYNAAALIDRCLDSVFNQTTGYAYEVICVDDGSKDNSVALIEGRNNPNIRVVKQQNAGPAVLATGAWRWHEADTSRLLMRMTTGRTDI